MNESMIFRNATPAGQTQISLVFAFAPCGIPCAVRFLCLAAFSLLEPTLVGFDSISFFRFPSFPTDIHIYYYHLQIGRPRQGFRIRNHSVSTYRTGNVLDQPGPQAGRVEDVLTGSIFVKEILRTTDLIVGLEVGETNNTCFLEFKRRCAFFRPFRT
jgi:hypothetical protein